jgi:formamidopyrimidine-DNA glycosylase
MIELPEAVVIARQINETLAGKRITQTVANASPHKFAWYTGDPKKYPALLTGRTIQDASAYGNHVEICTEDKMLVISTPIRYHPAGEKPPKKHQLYLELDDHSAVSCTVQMWGAMLCLPKDGSGGLPDYQIARQKPSPLSKAFDRAYFKSLFDPSSGALSGKEFLATKQRIPGLGNGVLQDILWTAQIHPRRKMGDLASQELKGLYEALKHILAAMTKQGGRDTERDLFGLPGGYKTILSKNTVGTPCPACGTSIRKEAYLGGAIYYCSGCQQL